MIEEHEANSQIVDAVSSTVTLAVGQSPAQAQGMIDAVMLETLGMAMYNAVNRQQSAGMISSAAVTAACARILAQQPPPPPPAEDKRHTVVTPLAGPYSVPPAPTVPTPAVVRAAAPAEGQTAIQVPQAQETGSATNAAAAHADLQTLAAAAATAAAAASPPSAP